MDLAATKVKVILDRATYKDYLDIDTLIKSGITLEEALSAAQAIYGKEYNPLLSMKALTYFEDGDVKKLPVDIKKHLAEIVRNISLEHPPITAGKKGLKNA